MRYQRNLNINDDIEIDSNTEKEEYNNTLQRLVILCYKENYEWLRLPKFLDSMNK
jgi:hypothetical protein